jgi:multimeric flavodoxin WrbA
MEETTVTMSPTNPSAASRPGPLAIGIVGSPRHGGNTERLVGEALATLEASGAKTELIRLGGREIKPCEACLSCRKTGRCVIDDDFEVVYDRMVAADAIIVGSPVYFGSPTPNILALLHRAGYVAQSAGRPFERKIGGPIVVARRAGQNFTLAQLMFFFLHQGMIVPGSTYWNIAFGREPGEVENDEEGMRTVRKFAENVGWLLGKMRE